MAGVIAAQEQDKTGCSDIKERVDAMAFDVRIEAHSPFLYNAVTPAEYNAIAGGFEAVGDKELDGYKRLGYIVVDDALNQASVDEILEALADVVANAHFVQAAAETARRQAAGEMNLAFGGCNPVLQFENFAKAIPEEERYKLGNIRKLMGFHEWDPRLKALAEHPGLLHVVRRMLLEAGSSEEEVREFAVFQSLALLKPRGGREKPWHQDNSYFNIDGSEVKAAGVWIALSEVTVENGAMHVLPASLADLRPIPHFSRRDWQICDSQTDGQPCVAVPLSPGGALFFSTLLPHGTPTNTGDTQRLAIQFHFVPKGYKTTCDAARLATYGGEGLGVSC
eukprot:TRINITY_DN71757_c0_g1_i1.p1 TRINITY_DN71757_c0_g1~~TRINITY_DN71757_c0_g1_i1.p1  ORF type:complete len:354 (+),score=60.66 TRINITY_DN71757_c0_g1_i1:54-1064(+)